MPYILVSEQLSNKGLDSNTLTHSKSIQGVAPLYSVGPLHKVLLSRSKESDFGLKGLDTLH